MAELNKEYGGNIVTVGSNIKTYPRIPSGSLGLDLILGGGWPANCWNEVVADPSAGKTSLAYATVAANQRRDPNFTTVWVAAEEWHGPWAEAAGCDTSRIVVIETSVMEEAYAGLLKFATKQAADLLVIDSLPALMPDLENGKDIGEVSPGRGAYLTGQFFRKAGKAMRRIDDEGGRPIYGMVINQWRMKIGISFGDPRTTGGGLGKEYRYYTRVELARDEWLEATEGKEKDRIGQTVRAKTLKNKTAPPQRLAKYDLYFDEGGPVPPGRVDYAKEIVTLGTLYGIVRKSGSWYSYDGQQLGQGSRGAADALRSNPDLLAEVERQVLQVATRT